MKIGDEVYVHGYVDEIRQGVVIIRNDGGYFGTVPSECYDYKEDALGYGTMNEAEQTEPQIEYCPRCGMRILVDKDINVRSKTEPQQVTSKLADIENSTASACESTMGQPKIKLKDEPQTDWKDQMWKEACREEADRLLETQMEDEPQTDCYNCKDDCRDCSKPQTDCGWK